MAFRKTGKGLALGWVGCELADQPAFLGLSAAFRPIPDYLSFCSLKLWRDFYLRGGN
jgi:hypothetical protein